MAKLTEADIGYIDVPRGKIVYPVFGREFPLKPEEEVRLVMVRKLVLEYDYDVARIGIEVPVKAGSAVMSKRADIVVFNSSTNHDPASQAYIVVEVKKKNRKDGVDQMQTYCNNTTAEFGIWYNGSNTVRQQRLSSPHKFENIPDIPKHGETIDDVGVYKKSDLVHATDLQLVFQTIHNHIYANEGYLKEKAFNEMLKLIFIKMVDEKSPAQKCEFRITAKEQRAIEDGKDTKFPERIEGLFDTVKNEYGDVFEKNDMIKLKASTLAFVVGQLQRFNLRDTKADVKGTAFQTFVYAHQRGDRGEFFTPHPVAQLLVDTLKPRDGEFFIDPACGSGGLLVEAMNYVWREFRQSGHSKDVDLLKYAHTYIKGIDFNPDLAKVAKMHLVLFDDGHTGVFSADSLEAWSTIAAAASNAGVLGVSKGKFGLVLTNPPFGSKGKVTDKAILARFALGHRWKKDKASGQWKQTKTLQEGQAPDILFIERCLELLAEGGRLGVVLPNSDLNNLSLQYVRQYIMERARILGVVSLPPGTFKSAGANPQPSVLLLQKLSTKDAPKLNAAGYSIFMGTARKLGYDLKTKTAPLVFKKDSKGKLLLDASHKPILDSDTPEIVAAFHAYRKKHGLTFHKNDIL